MHLMLRLCCILSYYLKANEPEKSKLIWCDISQYANTVKQNKACSKVFHIVDLGVGLFLMKI